MSQLFEYIRLLEYKKLPSFTQSLIIYLFHSFSHSYAKFFQSGEYLASSISSNSSHFIQFIITEIFLLFHHSYANHFQSGEYIILFI